MRILVINYEFPPVGGGGGRAAEDLCRILAGRGHDIIVQTSHVRGLPKIEERDGYTIYRSFSMRRRADRCAIGEMAAFLITNALPSLRHALKWRPEIVHIHFAVPTGVLGWLIRLLTHIPYVMTVQLGDVPGGIPEQTDRIFRFVKPFTVPIWRRAAAVIAVGDHIGKLARQSYHVPLEVIPNGIDLKKCKQSPLAPAHPKRLIFAGRFNAQKNLLFLVEVMDSISDLPWHLDMLGDGPLMDPVKNKIKEKGLGDRICLHGWVDSGLVEDVMGRSDILILPSTSEGLPLVGTMALGHGLAIIGSHIGGISDLIQDGKNGFLCPVNDLKAFEHGLRLTLTRDHLLKKMKEESKRLANNFDLAIIASRYEKIFNNV